MCADSIQLVECPISTSHRQPTRVEIRSHLSSKSAQMFRWHFLLLFFAVSVVLFCWVLYVYADNEYEFEFRNGTSGDFSSEYAPHALPAKRIILMWTPVFREESLQLPSNCPLFDQCLLTYDRHTLAHADAVVYHIPDLNWTSSDLPPSKRSVDHPILPEQNLLPANVLNVFLSQENPSTLRRYYHSENLKKAAGSFFHSTMTYLRSSDFPLPYGGFWVPPDETLRLGFTPVNLPNDRAAILKDKTVRGVVWFVSNCHTESKRELAVMALSKHMLINIGGKCAKSERGKSLCPRNATSCDHFFAAHYFFIAAENDICKEYVTEKYWHRYHLPAIPIVMREHVYKGIVPTNSFIAMDQFESPKAMADHLNFLMNNPAEYLKYFEWRAQNWSVAPWNHRQFLIAHCALCDHLLNRQNQSLSTRPSPFDAVTWFERNSQCEGDEFAKKWSTAK